MSDALLGAWEERVLLAVAHAGDEAYGMHLRREIERRSGRDVTLGAVYATLDRLEAKAYLASRSGPGDASRRGRARRYFDLLPAGAHALQAAREVHDRMWEGVDLAAARGAGPGG